MPARFWAIFGLIIGLGPIKGARAQEAALWQERFFYDALLSARDRLARGQSDPQLVPMMRSVASQTAQQVGNLAQIQSYIKVQQGALRYAFAQEDPSPSLRTIQANFATLTGAAEQVRSNLYYLTARCRLASSQALPDPAIYQAGLLIIGQIQQLQLGLNSLYTEAVAVQGLIAANPWAVDTFFNHSFNGLMRSVTRTQESIFSIYNSAYDLSWRSR